MTIDGIKRPAPSCLIFKRELMNGIEKRRVQLCYDRLSRDEMNEIRACIKNTPIELKQGDFLARLKYTASSFELRRGGYERIKFLFEEID